MITEEELVAFVADINSPNPTYRKGQFLRIVEGIRDQRDIIAELKRERVELHTHINAMALALQEMARRKN